METVIFVEKFLQTQEFTSKRDGTLMRRYSFVGETREQYPRKICFTCLGDETWKKLGIEVGHVYRISFDVSSREWQGRWFTDVSAWRAIPMDDVQGVQGANVVNSSSSQAASSANVGVKPVVEDNTAVAQPSSEVVNDDGLPF